MPGLHKTSPKRSYISSKVDTNTVTGIDTSPVPSRKPTSWKSAEISCPCWNDLTCCIRNSCLPYFGVNRCRDKKYGQDDPEAEILLKKWDLNTRNIYNFFHARLKPALRPLALELYFHDGQIEADGLTVLCAKIWTATFILCCNIKALTTSQMDRIFSLYKELIWASERAMKINQLFYSCQQKFKKNVMPYVWELEDKYCSDERKEFLDIQFREDLSAQRPFDGLYLNDKLEIKSINDLQLLTISKESWPPFTSHKEEEQNFRQLKIEKKHQILLDLLNSALKSYQKVSAGIEAHYRILLDDNVVFDTSVIKCSDSLELNSSYLKSIYKTVNLRENKKIELTDRAGLIIDEATSYLILSQWICDRLAEIAGMTQLCYQFLTLGCNLNWTIYEDVLAQADGVSMKMSKKKSQRSSKEHREHEWRSSAKLEYQEALNKFFKTEKKQLRLTQHSGDQAGANVEGNEIHGLEVTRDFLCTEYPWLLTRLCILMGDMKLKFKVAK